MIALYSVITERWQHHRQKDTTRTKKKMVLPRSPPTMVMYSDPASCCLNICMAANEVRAMVNDRTHDVPLDTAVIRIIRPWVFTQVKHNVLIWFTINISCIYNMYSLTKQWERFEYFFFNELLLSVWILQLKLGKVRTGQIQNNF